MKIFVGALPIEHTDATETTTKPGLEYLGCFYRAYGFSSPSYSDLSLPYYGSQQNLMTPDFCAKACLLKSQLYSAVQSGDECLCSSLIPDERGRASNEGECDTPCRGDSQQICGGSHATSIYFGKSSLYHNS